MSSKAPTNWCGIPSCQGHHSPPDPWLVHPAEAVESRFDKCTGCGKECDGRCGTW